MNNNSILTASASVTGVIVVVKSLINLARAMAWFSLTEEQWSAWSVFFETVIPIAAVWVGAWWISRNTTNLAKPTDIDGTPLTRPDNSPAIGEMTNLQTEALDINLRGGIR